ncbi:hypothetical protein SCUCBS95973_000619 [Sporothrix curviconia]|uniref:DNA repair metallo-beta-lactamase domain-containing protein n=1 Tax=Sporothrix curviconia TaxID=1260050 RepID=A0ABP0ARP3_9PEZI
MPAPTGAGADAGSDGVDLSRSITFPYSRHSSYPEQCDLLDKLRPKDVWPCTVHPEQWFAPGVPIITIEDLFGRFCSGDVFRFDAEVASKYLKRAVAGEEDAEIIDSQATTDPGHGSEDFSLFEMQNESHTDDSGIEVQGTSLLPMVDDVFEENNGLKNNNSDYPYFYHNTRPSLLATAGDAQDSQSSQLSDFSRDIRFASHQAAVMNAVGTGEWVHIRLASTADNHTVPDVDLGVD